MAQKSYPWPRGVAADSLVGYTAKEWYAPWLLMAQAGGVVVDSLLYSASGKYNQGVWYSVDNQLTVTVPANNRVDVAKGAALVDGAMFYMTTAISAVGGVTSPAINPRIDRVVVRKNFAAANYVPASASAALFTVPSYTARVTIIHGAEAPGPVAPALTQDTTRATYWDVPLFQYQISVAGAMSNLTDERDYVDAVNKYMFVPAQMGRNWTDSTDIPISWYAAPLLCPVIAMPDNKLCQAAGFTYAPSDMTGQYITSKGVIVVVNGAGNNIYAVNQLASDTCGEVIGTNNYTSVYGAEAIEGANEYSCHRSCLATSISVGDILRCYFERNATDPLDTVGDAVYFIGWLLNYMAWR